jgi:MFS family permease
MEGRTDPDARQGNSRQMKLSFAFRALRHRNYRLFFSGQAVSLIGTWITRVALGWLVYQLTHSPFMLGVVGFAGLAPTFLLTPFGGVLADRFNRHRLIVATQVGLMLSSFALGYFALRKTIDVPHIIILVAIQGVCNAFDIPTRQAFVVQLVEDRADLGSAIAMNSMVFNSARLVGPSVAGLLVAVFGEAWCFLIDGFSFLAVIAALLAMRIRPDEPRPPRTPMLTELRDGFKASFGSPPIRDILLLVALTSAVGMPYTVLMPVFADKILHGDATTLGFLMGATGVGALLGAIVLAMRTTVLGLGKVIAGGAALFGLSLIGFGLSRQLWLSLVLLGVSGFAMMAQTASSNTVVQTLVDDAKRGRVMSFFAMAFMGVMPFGNLLAGIVARKYSAPTAVVIGGLVSIVAAVLFARRLPHLRPLVRPIYAARGIIHIPVATEAAPSLATPALTPVKD